MANETIHRVLVRCVNWIGDAVMATPALAAIRGHFPQADITLLANPLVAQLFTPHPAVDRVMTFDRTGRHRGLTGRLRLARELRAERFQLAIILPNSFDAALVPWLAGIPARLGKRSDGRGLLLTACYAPDDQPPLPHEVDYYRHLVGAFGIDAPTAPLCLTTTSSEDRTAAELLAAHGIKPEDAVIGVNPGATYGAAKRWYPDRFADVARQLAAAWGARPVIFGSPNEAGIAADIEQRLEGAGLNMAGKTSVRELMALIKRCTFFITNDSGPMHIAAAFDVPTVAIFGSTDHATTSPYGNRAIIIRHDTDCAPCKLRECPTDHRCMTAVTVDDVVQAALRLRQRITGAGL